MNIAVIVAGGVGSRMGQSVPKQFINVFDKPVIIYTLESFEKNPQIDYIELVCLSGWENTAESYAKKFNIKKLKWIIKGGNSVQESIRNGVYNLKGFCSKDDIIIIHDGVRPLVDDVVLSDVINTCEKYGNAVSSMPYTEQIFIKQDDSSTKEYIVREKIMRVVTPQAYKFDLLYSKYQEAFEKQIGIYGSSYTNTMMVDLGQTLYFASGSDKNIKLTTQDNLEWFKTYLTMNKTNK